MRKKRSKTGPQKPDEDTTQQLSVRMGVRDDDEWEKKAET